MFHVKQNDKTPKRAYPFLTPLFWKNNNGRKNFIHQKGKVLVFLEWFIYSKSRLEGVGFKMFRVKQSIFAIFSLGVW